MKFKTRQVEFALAIVAFFVLALMSLEPNPSYIALDEFFTLPERLWFVRDNAGWLRHLLDFAQNRFINVGDFSLFRPLLFFQCWLEDMAGRDHRDLFHVIAVTAGVGWALSTYVLLRRYVSFLPAILLSAVLLLSPALDAHNYFVSWPHLTGYSLALMLFNVGLLLLPREGHPRDVATLVLSACCFVIAGWNHEFVVPALLILVLLLALWLWYERGKGSLLRQSLFATGAGLLILGAVDLAHFLWFSEFAVPLREQDWQPIGVSLWNLAVFLASPLLPGFTAQNALIVASLAVAMTTVFFLLGIVGLRRDRLSLLLRDPVALGAFAACTAIVAGVFVGRILIDGWTPFWYFRLLAGYQAIVLAAASTAIVAKRERPVQAVLVIAAIVLTYGLIRQTRTLHRNNTAIAQSNQISSVVTAVQQQLAEHGSWCFAGIKLTDIAADPKFNQFPIDLTLNIPTAVAAVSTILQYESCSERAGSPVYFSVAAEGGKVKTRPLTLTPGFFHESSGSDSATKDGETFVLPAPLYEELGTNIQALRKTHNPRPFGTRVWDGRSRPEAPWRGRITAGIDGTCPCEIRMRVESDDSFPRMYNLGFLFDYGQPNAMALLLFENKIVLGRFENERLHISSLGFVPDMRAPLDLVVRSDDSGCLVFANRQLVVSDGKCALTAGSLGTLTWPNGTPSERVTGLVISSNVGREPLFMPAQ
jgi:hypothetical protein